MTYRPYRLQVERLPDGRRITRIQYLGATRCETGNLPLGVAYRLMDSLNVAAQFDVRPPVTLGGHVWLS